MMDGLTFGEHNKGTQIYKENERLSIENFQNEKSKTNDNNNQSTCSLPTRILLCANIIQDQTNSWARKCLQSPLLLTLID